MIMAQLAMQPEGWFSFLNKPSDSWQADMADEKSAENVHDIPLEKTLWALYNSLMGAKSSDSRTNFFLSSTVSKTILSQKLTKKSSGGISPRCTPE